MLCVQSDPTVLMMGHYIYVEDAIALDSWQLLFDRLQWGSEYRLFEHQKHLNVKLFEVWFLNGPVFK